jgi:hypothetical protein
MVRYLVGELKLPAEEIDRTLTALSEYFEAHSASEEVEVRTVVQGIVERTMLPWGQVERILTSLLALSARLDEALGSEDTG